MDDSSGVSRDEQVGQNLDQGLNFLDLILSPVEAELCLEHLHRAGLLVVWRGVVGLKHIAVGVAPGAEIYQVIHGGMEQLVGQAVVVGKVFEGERQGGFTWGRVR